MAFLDKIKSLQSIGKKKDKKNHENKGVQQKEAKKYEGHTHGDWVVVEEKQTPTNDDHQDPIAEEEQEVCQSTDRQTLREPPKGVVTDQQALEEAVNEIQGKPDISNEECTSNQQGQTTDLLRSEESRNHASNENNVDQCVNTEVQIDSSTAYSEVTPGVVVAEPTCISNQATELVEPSCTDEAIAGSTNHPSTSSSSETTAVSTAHPSTSSSSEATTSSTAHPLTSSSSEATTSSTAKPSTSSSSEATGSSIAHPSTFSSSEGTARSTTHPSTSSSSEATGGSICPHFMGPSTTGCLAGASSANMFCDHETEVRLLNTKIDLLQATVENLSNKLMDQTTSVGSNEQAGRRATIPATTAARSVVTSSTNEAGLVWIIPEVLYNDDRVRPALHQLTASVHRKLEVRALPSSSITLSHARNLILPVVAASRVGSDLSAAINRANLRVPPVVLIFNCLAPHMSRIRTPTKDRLSDRQLVNSCTDILDVVFWNGQMYSCEANTKTIKKLREMWDVHF